MDTKEQVLAPELQAQAKKNLAALLANSGVQKYAAGEPIWDQVTPPEQMAIVTVGQDGVSEIMSDYDGKQLKIVQNGEVVYASIKDGHKTDQKQYKLGLMKANRDWEEFNITEGKLKLFAFNVQGVSDGEQPSTTNLSQAE